MKEKQDSELYARLHADGDDDEQELTNSKSVSFLEPYTIDWMNRHRPLAKESTGGAKLMAHLTPAQALSYREIFNNLDFDGSGGISLEEMEEGINYVAKHEPDCVQDPVQINKFFKSMDADGNGTIDLNEFLLGMTLENSKTDEKMAKAFFNFGKMHRRHTLIELLEDKNIEDCKKFKEFTTLFNVHKEFPTKNPTTVEEQVKQHKIQAAIDKKNLGARLQRLRKLEISRSNSALLNLSLEKTMNEPNSIVDMLASSNLSEKQFAIASRSSRQLLSKNLSNFKNKKRDAFAPPLSTVRSLATLKMGAFNEARLIKL